MNLDVDALFEKIKKGPTKYDEEIHPKMILRCMMKTGRISDFCTEALITDRTLYNWANKHDLFAECLGIGKMFARDAWELEGEILRDMTMPIGTISNAFEHWKMIGWSRFGISKNSRIKLDLNPDDTPNLHYSQLLKQAANGDFTASEIKQLMEAINVGLNTHQVFELQKQLDELKSDLATMQENSNGHNSSTNKRIAQKD